MLQFDAMPAERMRGAKLVENFRDALSVASHGWTAIGSPTYAAGGGVILNGVNQYLSLPLGQELSRTTLAVHLEWYPVSAIAASQVILDTSATNRFCLSDLGGGLFGVYICGTQVHRAAYAVWNALLIPGQRNLVTITKEPGAACVVWLNGSVVANALGVTAPVAGATTPLIVGKHNSLGLYYAGTFKRLLIGQHAATLAEHTAYWNNSMFSWRNRATVDLQFRTADYDIGNVRTLDSSGNGNHFTLGDGVTPTTYPTQGNGRMGFDGGDHLARAAVAQPAGEFSVALTTALTNLLLVCPSEHGVLPNYNHVLLRLSTGVFRFYVGNSAYAYSAAYTDKLAHTVVGSYNGAIAQIYVDGVAGTASGAASPVGGTSMLDIGRRTTSGGEITGTMYDFKYFDGVALNATQAMDYHQDVMSRIGSEV